MSTKQIAIFLGWILLSITFAHTTTQASSVNSDAKIQHDILKYVNAYRASHGLNPLSMNTAISKEATQHSLDMATHRISFGHKYFDKRIKHIYARIPNCQAGAENVAFNYKDTKELVRLWQQSPGHRQNIYGHYNLTGIGIARDKQGKMYYTQLFIRTNPAAKVN